VFAKTPPTNNYSLLFEITKDVSLLFGEMAYDFVINLAYKIGVFA
jgi:hypothetical protein